MRSVGLAAHRHCDDGKAWTILPLVRCFYHPGYSFPLPEGHPFPMDKFWRVERMVREECASARITIVKLASAVQLLRVHTSRYLADIRTGALSRESLVRLGLPPCEGLLTRSRRETAGTIAAMWAAIEEGLACNLAGGTHHAFADRGLGYCVLNDVAIAIRDLHALHPKKRVIDTDAHQGNGNNAIFADDDRVFTYSIHVGPNYPAEKIPGSLDIALPRFVDGGRFLDDLFATLPGALKRFAPDLVFWIAGSDPHEHDLFGQMRLSDADMDARDKVGPGRDRENSHAGGCPLRRRLQSRPRSHGKIAREHCQTGGTVLGRGKARSAKLTHSRRSLSASRSFLSADPPKSVQPV